MKLLCLIITKLPEGRAPCDALGMATDHDNDNDNDDVKEEDYSR